MDVLNNTKQGRARFAVGKEAISKTFSYYASFIMLGLVVAVIGPTLPGLAEQTRVRLSEISYLFMANSLGYLVGSLLGGRFYDRTSGHPLMAGAMFSMLAMLALVPLIPLLWILMLVVLVIGFTSGVLDVGGNTLLLWIHGGRVGPFMSGLHFCFGLGALISPLIVAQALKMGGQVQWAYWIIAVLIAPVGLVVLRLPSPKIHAHSDDGKTMGDGLFVLLMAFFFFLHVGAEISFGGWIFTYSVNMNLADKAVAAYLTSLFWGSLTLGRLLGVPIASLVKPRFILIGDLVGCLIGVGTLLFLSQSHGALWFGTALMGLSIASIFPTSFTFAERHLRMSGKITSWFLVGASLGGMFFPWFIGQLFEKIGPRITMSILLIDLFAGLAVVLLLLRYASRRSRYRANA
ncbi:MAG: hypothetical protein AMS17_15430 [Spirochaetes bacterium DG_61]|nr:MAG: hypothetical protein AMS17_15430 [Spirochaetes bacterium DG_61]